MVTGQGAPVLLEALTRGAGRPHVYITLGKGGVGKTTVSILSALTLASTGARVLLASLDPAKHLIEYLGLPRALKETRVSEGLWAVQYEVEGLARRVAEEYARLLRQVMPGLTVINMEGVVKAVRHAPGFEEEVFLRVLRDLYARAERGDYDYIVVDTPPTGVTHRILNLPRLYLLWIQQLYELRYKIVSLRYTIARVMGEKREVRDPVLDKLQALHEDYKRLADTLRDPRRTSTILVATPEPLPVYETRTSLELLRDLGVPVRLIVANRVLPREYAEKLGVRETQERALRELASLECHTPCSRLAVMHHTRPPRSLEDVRQLYSLIRPLEALAAVGAPDK